MTKSNLKKIIYDVISVTWS